MVEELKINEVRSEIPLGELPTGELPTHITKSNYFRVIHVDGAFGGGTPTLGNIMMTVFSHRIPFPERIVNDSNGNEVVEKRVVKYGMEQEFEASLVMSLETAKILRVWLDNTIKNTEVVLQQVQQRGGK
jgi:hypothetical protein